MSRTARVVIPGFPHHVTQRGNRKQKTFFCDEDYRYYIRLLALYSRKAGTDVWAYCLMPNHVHLVMVPGKEDGLRAVLGEVHRRYTRYVNFREDWRGHLWQERFHSFVMDENYLLATVRYVERNPVVAGLCACPHQWTWSSARAHMKGQDDGLVQVAPMLERVNDWYEYVSNSKKYFQECDLIERHARTGRPLGSRKFIKNLEAIAGRPLLPRRPFRKPKQSQKVNCPPIHCPPIQEEISIPSPE